MAEDTKTVINDEDPPVTEEERIEAFKTKYLESIDTNVSGASSAYQDNFWQSLTNKYLPSDWDGKNQDVLTKAVNDRIADIQARGGTSESYATSVNTYGGYECSSTTGTCVSKKLSNLVNVNFPGHGPIISLQPLISTYGSYNPGDINMTWNIKVLATFSDGSTQTFGNVLKPVKVGYSPIFEGFEIIKHPYTGSENASINGVFTTIWSNNGINEITETWRIDCGMYSPDLFTVQEKLKKGVSPSPSPGPSSSSRLFIEATSGVSGRHGSPIPTVLEYTIPTARTDATVYGSGGDGGHGGGGGAGASCPLICEFETDKADSVNQTVYAQHHGYGGKGGAAGKGGNGCVIVFY